MLFACCGKSVEPAATELSAPAELTFGKPYAATITLEGLEEPVSYTDVVSPLGYNISIDPSLLEGQHLDDSDLYDPAGQLPLGLGGDYSLLISKVTPPAPPFHRSQRRVRRSSPGLSRRDTARMIRNVISE